MSDVTIIAIDIAKNVLPLHGGVAIGAVVFGKKLLRGHLWAFLQQQPPAVVAKEFFATAHH